MRRTASLVGLCVALLSVGPQAAGAGVLSLKVQGGLVHHVDEGSIRVTGKAEFGSVPFGTVARTRVFTDATGDGVFLDAATPAYQDLVAGFIEETPTQLLFTWQVVDLPDPPLYLPEITAYFWEMSLGDALFSIRAYIGPNGQPRATMSANCETDATNTTTCQTVPSQMTVTIDGVANTITVAVKRSELRDGARFVAVEGAMLAEADLFQGIAAYTGTAAFASGATGDQADMERPYVLGRHIEATLLPPGLGDAIVAEAGPLAAVGRRADGTYALDLPIFAAGEYEAIVRACVGLDCGPIARSPTITIND